VYHDPPERADVPKSECDVEIGLFDPIERLILFFWKEWPREMELSNIDANGSFRLTGECPHCGAKSVFPTVCTPYEDRRFDPRVRLIAVARCIGCRECILAKLNNHKDGYTWVYEGHYPLGQPNVKVEEEIPENIRPDFEEALRCQGIKAYNASAEMCRRALEAACINLGAPYSKVLNDMIDWLERNGRITSGLKDVAHQVRLGGDRAAHPPEDPAAPPKYQAPTKIEEEHANAIIEFARHFFTYVYVIPKRLPKFDFSKPKKL
jgi:hypothetical protein